MSRAAQPQQAWLFCYDVRKPRDRRRIAARLEAEGRRIQRSVFLTECAPWQARHLERQCKALIKQIEGDRLHACPLRSRSSLPVPWRTSDSQPLPDYWLC